jgi:myo-inositol-1(or 4)-monophosphatase
VLGVVYNPISDELFVAERGAGAVLNGVSIHVSACTEISEAVIGSGFPYDAWQNQDDNTREWAAMTRRAFSVRCDGAAAMDLCQVACGRLDGYWEKGLQPWDMAAGIVIVREAGGWVSDYRLGNEILERSELICGNKTLVNNMLAVIQK